MHGPCTKCHLLKISNRLENSPPPPPNIFLPKSGHNAQKRASKCEFCGSFYIEKPKCLNRLPGQKKHPKKKRTDKHHSDSVQATGNISTPECYIFPI